MTVSLIHTFYTSQQHVLSLLNVLCLHRLSGSGFQRRRSLSFRVHDFTSSLAVANPTTRLTQSFSGPHYIALERAQQEALLPAVHLLLGDFTIRTDRTENTVPNGTPIGYLV
jgi:hypothetical protein